MAQILAQGRLGIEAGIDQEHARGRLVGRHGERRGRRVAEREQMRHGQREAALEFAQPQPEVVAEGLERDVLGLARALPRAARIDHQRAVATRRERAHELHDGAARADGLARERRHDEQRARGVDGTVRVGENGAQRIPGVGGGRHPAKLWLLAESVKARMGGLALPGASSQAAAAAAARPQPGRKRLAAGRPRGDRPRVDPG